ncbi:MAG: DUF5361 domain-containing protein [Anaerovoracaceae bacterium]
MAETYGIYEYRALPVSLLGTLAMGLRSDSRLKMEMAGVETSFNDVLKIATVDILNSIRWLHTKDAEKGKNRPKSILETLSKQETEGSSIKAYITGKEFDNERMKLMKEGG